MAKPELRDHRKFLKLLRLLGEPRPHVMGYLECMWLRGYQTGTAFLGDADDVEAAAEYPGERGRFVAAAHQAGFIDQDADGTYLTHDLSDHAPRYAKLRMQRRHSAHTSARACAEMAETRTDVRAEGEKAPACAPNTKAQTENREPKPKTSEEPPPPPVPKKFVPPSVDEVASYVATRDVKIDPAQFVDFYTSKGWRVGSEGMKDWRACVRTWEKRANERGPPRARSRGEAETEYAKKTLGSIL